MKVTLTLTDNSKKKAIDMNNESRWPLDGTAPEAYERYIVPAWMGEWAQALIEMVKIEPGNRVLDVACGTGIVARKSAHFAGPSGNVAGLDADRKMLRAARQFAEREGVSSIEWYQGDATCIPFSKEKYDVVLCQQGLQFFPDRLKALQEMFRVLVPGGQLSLSVWRSLDHCPFLAVLADVIGRYLGDQSTTAFYASCSLADREELKNLFTSAWFQDIRIRLEVRVARFSSLEEFLPGYISVFPFADEIAALAPKDQEKMFNDITKSLLIYTDDYGLAAPMECHMVTARK
jgi:ubiquinone/menaquinone biosynthesis C-methylase UbiE